MTKRKFIVSLLIGIVVSCILTTAYCKYDSIQMQKKFDELDKSTAIQQLSELRGRVVEIEELSNNVPQEELEDALESISSTKLSNEMYLFSLEASKSSEIGEICEDYISQIDKTIKVIKYGIKSE